MIGDFGEYMLLVRNGYAPSAVGTIILVPPGVPQVQSNVGQEVTWEVVGISVFNESALGGAITLVVEEVASDGTVTTIATFNHSATAANAAVVYPLSNEYVVKFGSSVRVRNTTTTASGTITVGLAFRPTTAIVPEKIQTVTSQVVT